MQIKHFTPIVNALVPESAGFSLAIYVRARERVRSRLLLWLWWTYETCLHVLWVIWNSNCPVASRPRRFGK
jgi:hypothetical protein